MRGDSDLIVMIIAVLVALFIFSQILPRIVAAETGTADVQTPKVQEWVSLVIPGLQASTSVPKTASTPLISFSDAKDNCLLAQEMARALGDSLNMTKITCNCNRTLGAAEWKVCTGASCTQTDNVIDVVNDGVGLVAEASYVLSVSASDNFTWLCIQVEEKGEGAG